MFGVETRGDAGIVRLRPDLALLFTADFFAPVVDDPRAYGRISAANSLSDIWAMGGTPIAALNLVGFPDSLPKTVLRDILRGASEICAEAGVSIVGGHSVRDEEPKFGLAAVGTVHPKRVILNSTARPGDSLILTKAIGTGVVTTGIKRGLAPASAIRAAVASMESLNQTAADVMSRFRVHACTDVTGFGLLGHLHRMAHASRCGARIHFSTMPILSGVMELLQRKCYPGGTLANLGFLEGKVSWDLDGPVYRRLLADPQTSGGLLMAVHPRDASKLLAGLRRKGIVQSRIIGEVTSDPRHRIQVLA